ncbi:MAG TPA: cell surface protein SprA [Salinimicrobium sp.]|nr:cell surface protein SprA [Salinimicrobium sp.]
MAQETDSTATGYSLGTINLQQPQSIVTSYSYDPILDRYILTQTVGNIDITLPLTLTREEYEKRVMEESIRNYFKEKINAFDKVQEGTTEDQGNLLPNFYVNSSFFESIFGGNEIEVIPQGSVELDLGVLYTKQDNPAFSPRNRSNLTFDFNQRISLSLVGNVGTRLQVRANYDTESTFDFQNQIKLEYTPTEDDIIQKIEVGNVSMPLNSALIQGAQSLFGVKTELQFGKTRITGVFSEQKSERRTVNVEGGGTVEEFEKFILDYDENRHFFLAHYFRDNYDRALENYPFINSNIQITRAEVWITNRSNNTQNLNDARNIVAVQDLGEAFAPGNIGLDTPPAGFFNSGIYPDNSNNDFNPLGITGPAESILTPAIRDIATVDNGFGIPVQEGIDYVKLENARQLNPSEYTLDTQLGYISLNQKLNNDEILAVAFQFTVNGEVYQVGEFASDGMGANPQNGQGQNQAPVSQNLVVKMLKSTITNVEEPIWDLMMKNIYSLGAYQLQQEDFRMNILYTDPQPVNYLEAVEGTPLPEDVAQTPLLRVFSLDRLNFNNDPVNGGDGFFDYVPGITVDTQNGRIIFTTVEPFGEHLFEKLDNTPNSGTEDYNIPSTYNENQEEYVFRTLYTTTKTIAEQEDADKNKFQLKGKYTSSGAGGIPIGAFNVPQGSVTVTAGGRVLQEGVDYVVDYQLGQVQILDAALLASKTPIEISTENNAVFGQSTKRFTGINVEHTFSEKLLVGATFLNLNERPITQKANYGYEPINNSIYGFNFNYSTEVPFFTRLVNKLPNLDTDVESRFSLRGEFAYLQPGAPKGNEFEGQSTSYVDDFEASQTSISINSPLSWDLSSVPVGFGGEFANDNLTINNKRAKLAWYTIDPLFYSSQRPDGISDNDLSTYATRRVFINEIFPNIDIVQGQTQVVYTMDLAYYPDERGPYNFNPAANGSNTLPNPQENFGGISRAVNNTNFEQTNVEFIEFWLMDPFIYDENIGNNGGKITFNLGNISEDVLKDGRKQYENGLPEDGSLNNTITTTFGVVPANQSLVYAFDTEGQARQNQDAGFDGLGDLEEANFFPQFSGIDDPAADNYNYFLAVDGGIVERYRNYNGTDGNSPSEVTNTNRGNSPLPTVEDLNRDNTMNTIDSYFQYEVEVFPGMSVDNSEYITDVKTTTANLPNGSSLPVRWVQFKVPIYEPTSSVGGIADFRSIRFMRMFLSEFEEEVILRFGTMDLVRGDYRRYTQSLQTDSPIPENDNTLFEIAAVSIEENENRIPIPYVMPPGVNRENLYNNNTNVRQNEKSLSLRVCDLESQDARAVYKNFQIDMRQYKHLEMFLHAESIVNETPLQDGELVAFLRMGTDFTENYYQIEIPLKPTAFGANSAEEIWPEENRMNLPLELLQQVKSLVLGDVAYNSAEINYFDEALNPVAEGSDYEMGELRIGIKGNPSFGNVRVLMLGLKNGLPDASPQDVCGEVWFNELRLSEMKNEGGWAAILNMDTNFADFANVTATGRRSTIGFGSIEQGPNERSRDDVKQYDIVTNVNFGQLLPKSWGLKIPFNYSIGEEIITPQYDPEYLDLELQTRLDNAESAQEEEEILERAQNYTKRQSINLIGLRKERTGEEVPMPYDIENFAVSATYNQVDHRDFEIEDALDQNVRLGATYDYTFPEFGIEPFKNISALDSSEYYAPIKDFNFSPLPTSISSSSNIIRQYNEQKFREFNLPEGSIGIPTLYQRNFLFDWQYTLNYNPTKSLSLNYNSSNNRIVRNYIDEDNNEDNSIGIWDGFFNVGDPNYHFQSLQANYAIPFEKIPALKFLRATYTYSSDFQWQKGSEVFNSLEGIPEIGNSVQNSNSHKINATLDMQHLYNFVGLKQKKAATETIKERSSRVPTLNRNDSIEEEKAEPKNELSSGDKALNRGIGLLTAIKRIQISYEENQGTFLPGYTRGVGFAGTMKPTLGFVFGSQAEVRELAARNGWLTLYQEFNQQYSEVETKKLNLNAQLQLIPDLTIDLNANRIYAETFNENYRVDPDDLEYHSLTSSTYGNFNISTILIKTAFSNSDQDNSEAFEQFRANRLVVARRLAAERGLDPSNVDADGYPIGFGKDNQAVLLPAFLSAYSGTDAGDVSFSAFKDIPLPNWDIKYTGLMRLDWFKKNFKRFSIAHGYQAYQTINQFQTNLDYDSGLDQGGNFKNRVLYSNINLTELFSPLVKIDLEMQNSIKVLAEIRKDRSLSLSFDNNLLTEMSGNQYTLGLGYRIKDVKIGTRIEGRRRVLSSDLNFKADLSFRRNKTIIRYLDIDNSQTTAGQDIWIFEFRADYALTKNLVAEFYYDHSFSEYAISTAFPQTTIRSGITLRYNFGN